MLWACGSPSKLLTIQRAANSLTAPTRWKGWRDGYRGVVDAVANDNAEQLMMCLGYGMGPAQRKTVWLDTRVCELGMCEDANGGGKPAGAFGLDTVEHGGDTDAPAYGAWGNGMPLHRPEVPGYQYQPRFEGYYEHSTAPSFQPPFKLNKGDDLINMIGYMNAYQCAATLLDGAEIGLHHTPVLIGRNLERALMYRTFRKSGLNLPDNHPDDIRREHVEALKARIKEVQLALDVH